MISELFLKNISKTKLVCSVILFGSLVLLAVESPRLNLLMDNYSSLNKALTEPLYINEKAKCEKLNINDFKSERDFKEACRDAENEEFKIIGNEVLVAQEKLSKANARMRAQIKNYSLSKEKADEYLENFKYATSSLTDISEIVSQIDTKALSQESSSWFNTIKNALSTAQLEIKKIEDKVDQYRETFIAIMRSDLDSQTESTQKNYYHRIFHAKQHACLTAQLKLNTDSERRAILSHIKEQFKNINIDVEHELELLRRGIFNPNNANYDAIIRLSSGLGIVYPDFIPDVKGFAIKLLNVKDKKDENLNYLNPNDVHSVDLLMTSGPNPFGNTLRDFANFMNATIPPNENYYLYPPVGAITYVELQKLKQSKTNVQKVPLISSINSNTSLSTLRYWSGHPYLLGADDKSKISSAMKFNITPQESNGSQQLLDQSGNHKLDSTYFLHANHLREDLEGRFNNNMTLRYDLNIQLERDKISTPIESTVVEWKESDSPSIKVGEIIIEPQKFNQNSVDTFCEEASFTPAHYHTMNRPLSNMGRGRIVAYRASQLGRSIVEGKIPEDLNEESFAALKKLNGTSK